MRSRRLSAGALVILALPGLILAACQPQVVEVTKEVVVTQVVERVIAPTAVNYGELVWLSTQLRPVQEAEKVRGVILADFPGEVEFIPDDEGPFHDRVTAEVKAGQGTVDILGALHGNFSAMAPQGQLQDLTALRAALADRGIPEAFWNVAQLNTDTTYYVPWMQATYIIAVNKKALPYLPAGADVNALTYDQLAAWAKAIYDATGDAKLGFPAGESGLLHLAAPTQPRVGSGWSTSGRMSTHSPPRTTSCKSSSSLKRCGSLGIIRRGSRMPLRTNRTISLPSRRRSGRRDWRSCQSSPVSPSRPQPQTRLGPRPSSAI